MSINLKFFRGALTKPQQVGALAPTLKSISYEMIRALRTHPELKVIEVGPGTGAVTQHILPLMNDPSQYLGIEINPKFCETLSERFPGARFVNGNAESIVNWVPENEKADLIVCALPWTIFEESKQKKILRALKSVLKPSGSMTHISYATGLVAPTAIRFRKILEKEFPHTKRGRIIWNNIPPAFVYHCMNSEDQESRRLSRVSSQTTPGLRRVSREDSPTRLASS